MKKKDPRIKDFIAMHGKKPREAMTVEKLYKKLRKNETLRINNSNRVRQMVPSPVQG